MDGFVLCDCHRNGRTKPHPSPRLLQEIMPGVLVLSQNATDADWDAHEEWLAEGCGHSLMQEAYQFVHGLEIADAINHVFSAEGPGAEATTLCQILGSGDDAPAPTSPEEASRALKELEELRATGETYTVTRVVDADRSSLLTRGPGRVVYAYMGDGRRLEYGPEGLSLMKGDEVLFEADEVHQEELPDGDYRLTPADGDPFRTSAAFLPYDAENPEKMPPPFPSRVTLEVEDVDLSTLDEVLEPLKELLETAVRLDHCVVWTGNEDLLH